MHAGNLVDFSAWYQAVQIMAVLSVILLMPAMIVAGLYSYGVALRGRGRTSWLLLAFLIVAGMLKVSLLQ